jgi:hypothetical protein
MAKLAVSVEALNDVPAQRCVQNVTSLLDELVERQWPVTRDGLRTITHALCLADRKYCTWLCTVRTTNVAPNCVSSLREMALLSRHLRSLLQDVCIVDL